MTFQMRVKSTGIGQRTVEGKTTEFLQVQVTPLDPADSVSDFTFVAELTPENKAAYALDSRIPLTI